MQRIEPLEQLQEYHDQMRWRVLPMAVIKSVNLNGLTDASDLF
jgi:hypothetical protein